MQRRRFLQLASRLGAFLGVAAPPLSFPGAAEEDGRRPAHTVGHPG